MSSSNKNPNNLKKKSFNPNKVWKKWFCINCYDFFSKKISNWVAIGFGLLVGNYPPLSHILLIEYIYRYNEGYKQRYVTYMCRYPYIYNGLLHKKGYTSTYTYTCDTDINSSINWKRHIIWNYTHIWRHTK